MDKVKKYWQTVIKEREGFWSSLFSKYEEEKEDVDLRSYMDNSSSRIETLLQLAVANGEDANPEHPCTKVAQCSEEQPCEVSDTNLQLSDDVNQEPKQRKSTCFNHPVAQVKKAEPPAYVVEIMPEEEDEKWKSILFSTKKLKLYDSLVKTKDSMEDFVTDDQSVKSIESSHSEAVNESLAPNVSMQSEPLRFVCRRIKPAHTRIHSNYRTMV
ncbi:uncharacterized protein LOC130691934 isoform X2 [Daphnia carinata]|uniref:uncharacterized protein LOC130691934 isoform X2 n=1 Tax=Daphnia carinata TaxID=120202 RepID=UPI00257D2D09|nr:uncharacterized protein LOC130691934 isoform X2 [Daphnia carinata]